MENIVAELFLPTLIMSIMDNQLIGLLKSLKMTVEVILAQQIPEDLAMTGFII